MKAFILSLLPGLEEETGEYFETVRAFNHCMTCAEIIQVLGLMDKLSGAVSLSYFFQNVWLIMLTSPSARGTALNFLSRRLPKANADDGGSNCFSIFITIDVVLQTFQPSLDLILDL